MRPIIPFHEEDPAIEIESSEEFIIASHQVSKFVKSLPITMSQNNVLYALITQYMALGRQEAFKQGFNLGIDAGMEYYADK